MSGAKVAALFVETRGVYYGLEGVEPWDVVRDARTYAGPHPVVAHPPCARWGRLAKFCESVMALPVGADEGCFESALASVRSYGGVLEHPAWSLAWKAFALPQPTFGGWSRSLFGDSGWVTSVAQVAYGHKATKFTWLYVASERQPRPLRWNVPEATHVVSSTRATHRRLPELSSVARKRTPLAFRDELIELAREAVL